MRFVVAFNSEMKKKILRAKTVYASGEKNPNVAYYIFTALLESDLPTAELSTKRLQHETISVIGAGMETTMFMLTTSSYHLLANPDQLLRLRGELAAAIPDPLHVPSLEPLMQLPYLTYVLTVGAVVIMDHYTSSHDPHVFPGPHDFRPGH
ncbi:cytochrome p450 [Hirsutella rhossiliensis]|uniref:Cytochrome p450 domain-containing protein n=1 Tax=Hirsutella rhossiliensis TaxID=111463 RepID=A0A9P8SG08_9HYPO|nr:cytochrome p450 domain-containing protein [Hirsutella rhossiliensis]KAH0959556.1 cytochrome p450 domain-containing protein [Hirsutella rhossiliensis]